MHLRSWLLQIVVLSCAICPGIRADIVYAQPPAYAPPNGASGVVHESSLDIESVGNRTFDNFALQSNAAVSTVEWLGFPSDIYPAGNPVQPYYFNWEISFYADAAGLPGSRLFDSYGSVTATQEGTTRFSGSTVNVYLFTAQFSTPFDAQGHTIYWFSPLALDVGGAEQFKWLQGLGGDGTSAEEWLNVFELPTSPHSSSGDLSFALIATPEPSALVLFASGGFLLVALSRRNFRRVRGDAGIQPSEHA